MRKDRQLGLDELMIVNPGHSGTEGLFLGEDGTLYQVQGLGEEKAVAGNGRIASWAKTGAVSGARLRHGRSSELGDGTGEDLGEDDARELGRYFLGADGALYEVVPIGSG